MCPHIGRVNHTSPPRGAYHIYDRHSTSRHQQRGGGATYWGDTLIEAPTYHLPSSSRNEEVGVPRETPNLKPDPPFNFDYSSSRHEEGGGAYAVGRHPNLRPDLAYDFGRHSDSSNLRLKVCSPL
jgi:hypothetical protein